MDYDPSAVEAKWRDRWAESGRYEADPGDDPGDATFVTVPYPYPSGGMHVGHCRTYTVPDVYARYRRLQGDDVLFPIAWHVTGTPIVGAVERLKSGDESQVQSLKDAFNVPEADLADLETPMGYARYFIEEAESSYKRGMQSLGLSIDWRREFTTNDDRYSKFIAWQYETLRDRGLLEQGLHPVKFCTNEEQPVTTHDLLEGEEAEYQEFTLVKFTADDVTIPMATLRPETVRGVTNAFVDPGATYVEATVDGERWLVSESAVTKLRLQAFDVTVEDEVPGSDLVGSTVTNPVTGDEVLVLPADFVDADDATGVVMSVPAHSPDDYVALRAIQADADDLVEYGIDPDAVRAIEPIPILTIDGYGEVPARDVVESYGIESTDDPALEDATQELYGDEFREGRLVEAYGEFADRTVEDVREEFREVYAAEGAFAAMYEFTEDVVCRCGGHVEVAEQDTWFLRYDDEAWKAKAREAVAQLDAVPENTRDQYEHTVEWLEEWPCIRNYGLGTRLPWDQDFVIEPLSDSTIYMAYYTVAHRLDDVPVDALDRAFFDTLFYGADAVETAAVPGVEEPREPDERALELREEYDYWYPVDYRCSGNDLINNHLTFSLFHHAELFDDSKWPEGFTVMGMGLLEGEKMSSSKGHVVLPTEAIETYGADTVRFFLLNSAEPWQDYDWRAEEVSATRDQLERFWDRADDVVAAGGPDEEPDLARVDRWLLSRLQHVVREATDALDRFETRRASQAVFYRFAEDLRWYRRRTDTDRPGARWTLREVLRTRLRLLAPFVPFLSNELHERLTGDPVEDAAWPEPDPERESTRVEVEEELVESLLDDLREVVEVTGTDPDRITVYTAAPWKHRAFEAAREAGADVGAAMSEAMQDDSLRERGDAVNDLVGTFVEVVREREDGELAALSAVDEAELYADAAGFLADAFDASVEVVREADTDDGAADDAEPFRPAIQID